VNRRIDFIQASALKERIKQSNLTEQDMNTFLGLLAFNFWHLFNMVSNRICCSFASILGKFICIILEQQMRFFMRVSIQRSDLPCWVVLPLLHCKR